MIFHRIKCLFIHFYANFQQHSQPINIYFLLFKLFDSYFQIVTNFYLNSSESSNLLFELLLVYNWY